MPRRKKGKKSVELLAILKQVEKEEVPIGQAFDLIMDLFKNNGNCKR